MHHMISRSIGIQDPDWPQGARWKVSISDSSLLGFRIFLDFGFEPAPASSTREQLLIEIERSVIRGGEAAFKLNTTLPSPEEWTTYIDSGGISWRVRQVLFDYTPLFCVFASHNSLVGEQRRIRQWARPRGVAELLSPWRRCSCITSTN
jgi:hypothetical protein